MKLGVLADIHGDLTALESAWSHLVSLGADRIVSAGDVVGYGPMPDETVEFLRARSIDGVRGNHDRWAIERGPGVRDPFGGPPPLAKTIEYLRRLPSNLVLADLDNPRVIVVVVHATIRSDTEFVNRSSHPPETLDADLKTLDANIIINGHTHNPMFYRSHRGLVINPGSVVSAAAVKTSRSFALLDLATFEVAFFDVESAARIEAKPWSVEQRRASATQSNSQGYLL